MMVEKGLEASVPYRYNSKVVLFQPVKRFIVALRPRVRFPYCDWCLVRWFYLWTPVITQRFEKLLVSKLVRNFYAVDETEKKNKITRNREFLFTGLPYVCQ
jgi:hypothetical protein